MNTSTRRVLFISTVFTLLTTERSVVGEPEGIVDPVSLTVVKGRGAGQITLSSTGGLSPCDVYRSAVPTGVVTNPNRLGTTGMQTWIDTPPPGNLYFYNVVQIGCVTNNDCAPGHYCDPSQICVECTMADDPDPTFTDSNCDGIDGDVSRAVFVDIGTGNDANPGTMAQPRRTITGGILRALNLGRPHVYVSQGSYFEAVSMANGVSVYGAYRAASGWSRASGFTVEIFGSTPALGRIVGVDARFISSPTVLDMVRVTTGSPGGFLGISNYGVYVLSSPHFVLSNSTVTAGPGSTGNPGMSGFPGANGPAGSAGGPGVCEGNSPGQGGNGGVNGSCATSGGRGGDGGGPSDGGAPGSFGSGGACGGNGGNPGDPGVMGLPGCSGSLGVPAAHAPGGVAGGTVMGGFWVANRGGDGGSGGPGTGGGGGGGGGGEDCIF